MSVAVDKKLSLTKNAVGSVFVDEDESMGIATMTAKDWEKAVEYFKQNPEKGEQDKTYKKITFGKYKFYMKGCR